MNKMNEVTHTSKRIERGAGMLWWHEAKRLTLRRKRRRRRRAERRVDWHWRERGGEEIALSCPNLVALLSLLRSSCSFFLYLLQYGRLLSSFYTPIETTPVHKVGNTHAESLIFMKNFFTHWNMPRGRGTLTLESWRLQVQMWLRSVWTLNRPWEN